MQFGKTALSECLAYCYSRGLIVAAMAVVLCVHSAHAEEPSPPPSSELSESEQEAAEKIIADLEQPLTIMTAIRKRLGIMQLKQKLADNKSAVAPSDQAIISALEKMVLGEEVETPAPKVSKHKNKKLKKGGALAGFYSQQDRQPIWVSKTSVLKKTRAVIDEFKHADAYGLRTKDFILPQQVVTALAKDNGQPTVEQLAAIEIALSKTVLKYARYAKGGRINPKRLSRYQDRTPTLPNPKKVLASIANASKPAEQLRAYHPQHPQFEALRKKLVGLTSKPSQSRQKAKRSKARFPVKGPSLKLGMKHAQIALLRKRLGIKGKNTTLFDKPVRAGVMNFQKKNGLGRDGVVGPGTRRALAGIRSPKQSSAKLRARILINMERWRWLPEKLQGNNNIYVWANIPELRVRIIRDNKVIFTERAIAGKPDKQSPMFSDKLEWIEFNPTWYIPNSIKVADILPSLRGKGRVMSRYHLRLDCGKFGTDFRKINWKKVDIRKCSITQPTGAKSVLGKLKFKFPNKHSVYMHDTLTPGLFNRKHRVLSHGCIRVRNPRRMAEVLLAHDKGMSAKKVGSLLARKGLHTERLKKSVPVHITYFSTRVTKKGKLAHFPDYYGHDKRLAKALLGKGHLFKRAVYGGKRRYKRRYPRIPKPDPTPSVNPAFFPEQ
jgi:L,D-transpeptidase YcbB